MYATRGYRFSFFFNCSLVWVFSWAVIVSARITMVINSSIDGRKALISTDAGRRKIVMIMRKRRVGFIRFNAFSFNS